MSVHTHVVTQKEGETRNITAEKLSDTSRPGAMEIRRADRMREETAPPSPADLTEQHALSKHHTESTV